MNKVFVQLPANRDFAGWLEIQNAAGKKITGPFRVCGRADDEAAKRNRNPCRDPLLPYGDIPFGEYQIVKIMPSGPGTSYGADEFGAAGVVLLRPKLGDAALADANGRFGFFIQGGARSRNRLLRPTQDGSLRLSDHDQRRFINAMQKAGEINCHCLVVCTAKAGGKVAVATAPARRPRRNSPASLLLAGSMVASAVTGTMRQVLVRKLLTTAGAAITTSGLALLGESHVSAQNAGGDYTPVAIYPSDPNTPVDLSQPTPSPDQPVAAPPINPDNFGNPNIPSIPYIPAPPEPPSAPVETSTVEENPAPENSPAEPPSPPEETPNIPAPENQNISDETSSAVGNPNQPEVLSQEPASTVIIDHDNQDLANPTPQPEAEIEPTTETPPAGFQVPTDLRDALNDDSQSPQNQNQNASTDSQTGQTVVNLGGVPVSNANLTPNDTNPIVKNQTALEQAAALVTGGAPGGTQPNIDTAGHVAGVVNISPPPTPPSAPVETLDTRIHNAGMDNDPYVKALRQTQSQLTQNQEAVRQAQADYDKVKQANPNADLTVLQANLADKQDRLATTQHTVTAMTAVVTAKLPPLPIGKPPGGSK